MNKKTYLSVILFFATIILSVLSAKSQDISDTIRIERNAIGVEYYQNNKTLKFNQLMDISANNQVAHKLIKNAYALHILSVSFSSLGGFMIGFSAGYAIGCAIQENLVDMKIFLPILGTGVGFSGIGIGFEVGANNKVKKGVAIFNHSIKQKSNTNINLGISTNGMLIKMNF